MEKISIKNYSSIDEVFLDINSIAEAFKESSIVCIRGTRATESEQLEITKKLGDTLSWTPNTKSDFYHEYTENHSRNPSATTSSGDRVILSWHIEHPDYDNYTPLVAGVWNMYKFTCGSNVGMTYFMDSRDVYESLFTEEEKSFLRKAESSWVETYSGDVEITNTAKVVVPHWIDGRELIRLEMHQLSSTKLFKIDGQNPTQEQEEFFQKLVIKFVEEVNSNLELRIVHHWQEGDILIPDLYTMIHAVTGGFRPEEREFTGYWCYIGVEKALKSGNLHPSWT